MKKPEKKPFRARRGDITILGIDPGSIKTGIAWLSEHQGIRKLSTSTIRLKGSRAERLASLLGKLEELLRGKVIDLIVIEAGSVWRFAKAALVVSETRGVALAAAIRYGGEAAVVEVQVQSVRKALGIARFGQKRNEGKVAVQSAVRALFGLEGSIPEDEADALALAWWGYFHRDQFEWRL